MSIFLTPFCDKFFLTFVTSSIYFMIEFTLTNYLSGTGILDPLFWTIMWWMLMFSASYFLRRVLTIMFLKQTEAKKTKETVTAILANLPDAVLMLDEHKLSYCNKQADRFFGVKLSHLTSTEETLILNSSTYQIMEHRCIH